MLTLRVQQSREPRKQMELRLNWFCLVISAHSEIYSPQSSIKCVQIKSFIGMQWSHTQTITEEDNFFLIVSYINMIKTKHKHLDSKYFMKCGITTSFDGLFFTKTWEIKTYWRLQLKWLNRTIIIVREPLIWPSVRSLTVDRAKLACICPACCVCGKFLWRDPVHGAFGWP